jgi:GT2 family glycosyltransferase
LCEEVATKELHPTFIRNRRQKSTWISVTNTMPAATQPLVSVVIPTYNRAPETIAAIRSVLAQTYRHIEIIVVDDGSTDNSPETIQRFIDQMAGEHPAIFLIREPNQGPSVARNSGIAKAIGEYIAFLDSDDVWVAEKLELQLQALEELRNECAVCFTDACCINHSGMGVSSFRGHGKHYEQTVGVDRAATISLATSFSGFWVSSLLVRSDVIRKIGGFSPDILFAEDRDLHFRLSLVSPVAYVNKQLIVTDRKPSPPGSTCRPWDKLEVQFGQQQRMLEKWLTLGPVLPPGIYKAVERNLGGVHSHWATWYLENNRYSEARLAVSRAVKHKPTFGITMKFVLTWLAPALAKRVVAKIRPIGTGGHAS